MKKLLLLLLTCTVASIGSSVACDIDGITGIVEENNLYIPAGLKGESNLTEEDFNKVLDRIERIYAPIVEEAGGKLKVVRKWNDGTVNAYAMQRGGEWQIHMFGGLARHETITVDAFAVVACHEIGHHIGGAPKKTSWFGMNSWASNEGQADYFGTSKCMRKYYEDLLVHNPEAPEETPESPEETPETDVSEHKPGDLPEQLPLPLPDEESPESEEDRYLDGIEINAYAAAKCDTIFTDALQRAICKRNSMAGESLGNLFRALRNQEAVLSFETPDPKVVSKTNHNHPAPQCRLDTYFAGALCNIHHADDLDQKDPEVNACTRKQLFDAGLRPLCWYKPEGFTPEEPDTTNDDTTETDTTESPETPAVAAFTTIRF